MGSGAFTILTNWGSSLLSQPDRGVNFTHPRTAEFDCMDMHFQTRMHVS